MTEREKLAYTAGIVDGEGSIQIVKQPTGYYVRVTVSSSEENLVHWLAKEFGGTLQSYQRARARRPELLWSIFDSKKAVAFLENLYPFLICKKKHAIIVFNFWNRKWHESGESFYHEIKQYQLKGKRSQ